MLRRFCLPLAGLALAAGSLAATASAAAAGHAPRAATVAHLLPGEGHLTLGVTSFGAILDDLLASADR
jgi:hypothetical protein